MRPILIFSALALVSFAAPIQSQNGLEVREPLFGSSLLHAGEDLAKDVGKVGENAAVKGTGEAEETAAAKGVSDATASSSSGSSHSIASKFGSAGKNILSGAGSLLTGGAVGLLPEELGLLSSSSASSSTTADDQAVPPAAPSTAAATAAPSPVARAPPSGGLLNEIESIL